MIWHGAVSLTRQEGRQVLATSPRQGIDDAALLLAPVEESEQLLLGVGLRLDGEADIRPVEAGDIDLAVAGEKLFDDVAARRFVGGRGHRADRHAGKGGAQFLQHVIFRPEGRAPLRDAMRLVDGEERHADLLQGGDHTACHQPFRRHVENAHLT